MHFSSSFNWKLQSVNFIVVGRLWFHIQNWHLLLKFPFHVFDWCWFHIQDLQEFMRRVFRICRHASLPNFPNKKNEFRDCEVSKNNMFPKRVSKVQNNWFGESRTRPKSLKIMKMISHWVSRKEIEKLLVPNEAE